MIDQLPGNHQDYRSGLCRFLCDNDLSCYISLMEKFHQEVSNARRGEKVETFNKRMKIIRDYVVKNDEDDWKRSFATGIIFLDNCIAINIKQLKQLIGKCKSSINGSLHQLGYVARPASKETDEQLVNKIPMFGKERGELKKWTIRLKKNPKRKQKNISVLAEDRENHESMATLENEKEIEPVIERVPDKICKIEGVNFPVPIKLRYKILGSYFNSLPVSSPFSI